MTHLRALIERIPLNASISWVAVILLLVTAIWNALTADFLWVVLTLFSAGLVVLPAVIHHDVSIMPPWEFLLFAVIPIASHALILPALVTQSATYLAVVALAAIAVIELQMFTPVEMTMRVAGVLMVLLTMATAGLWVILGWLSDVYLGTVYFSNLTRLMWDLITITVISLLAAPLFALYTNWRSTSGSKRSCGDEV